MLVLINLDSAVQRRQAMARQLERNALAFERVGVDLRCARPCEVQAQIQSTFPALRFDRKALSDAEIGCWLSHLTAWQRLLRQADGVSCCTVIEDDLTLLPGFANVVKALYGRRQQDAAFGAHGASDLDLIYLGTSSRSVSQRRRTQINGLWVHKPLGVIYNTWGYTVSRRYAERFFASGPRFIRLPIDHFLGGRGGQAGPRVGVLQPPVVVEDPVLGAASQIGPYTRRLDRSHLIESVRRRILASALSEFYYTLYRYL
ncbi:MAG TPA: glycosyltransferase family 25 protein [Burkholderiaceae bacterium]|nr:glycosyltransferase family 25 protein [Burkholderiaceae bacterium]